MIVSKRDKHIEPIGFSCTYYILVAGIHTQLYLRQCVTYYVSFPRYQTGNSLEVIQLAFCPGDTQREIYRLDIFVYLEWMSSIPVSFISFL